MAPGGTGTACEVARWFGSVVSHSVGFTVFGLYKVFAVIGGGERFERMVRQRVRIRFRKKGDLRLIGHRDLARLAERLFRRVGLRLSMSEGYHPKPRVTFPSALALGVIGLDEVLEVEVAVSYDPGDLQTRLADNAPDGFEIVSVALMPPGAKKGKVRRMHYTFSRSPRPARSASQASCRV